MKLFLAPPYYPPLRQSFGLLELEGIKPGLAEEVIAAGREVKVIHLMRPSGETIGKVPMTTITELVGYPFTGISRYALQRVLLGHLEDRDVQLGSRLEGLDTYEAEGVTELKFEGQADAVRARAVVGADGRRYGRYSCASSRTSPAQLIVPTKRNGLLLGVGDGCVRSTCSSRISHRPTHKIISTAAGTYLNFGTVTSCQFVYSPNMPGERCRAAKLLCERASF